jgi:uncharacterized Fe-S center protein
MARSDVYVTDMRAKPERGLVEKFVTIAEKAGFKELKLKKQFVAIKIHFGEPGNLGFIRPNFATRLAEMVGKAGGIPFLTDANTLYTGGRGNAVDHLASAARNGFTRAVVGCEVIIADGLKGMEFREIEINQKHCRYAKIASAIADSDVIITLSHFKGHELTGFGGAIKNLGMGSGSRGGKLFMHSASKPNIAEEKCTACAVCVKSCPQEAITLSTDHKVASIDYDKCVGCGQCIAMCQYNAAQAVFNESAADAAEKIAEYALAVVKDRPALHVNFVTEVAPVCDCYGYNDAAIVHDIGILSSTDPVALDRACVDLVNDAPVNPGSKLDDKKFTAGEDKFGFANPNTSWQAGLSYAESIGLGTQSYRLVKVN